MLKECLKTLIQNADESLLAEAFAIARNGGVLSARISDGLLKARVKDTFLHIYDLRANLRNNSLETTVCSCGKPAPCMHVAASVFYLTHEYKHPLPDTARSGQASTEDWLKGALRQTSESNNSSKLIFFLQASKQSSGESLVLYLYPKVVKNSKKSKISKWVNWSFEKREHQALLNPNIKTLLKTIDHSASQAEIGILVSPQTLLSVLEFADVYWYSADANYFDENDKLLPSDFEEAQVELYWRFGRDGQYYLEMLVDGEPVSLLASEQAYALDCQKQRILALRFQAPWNSVARLQKLSPISYQHMLQGQMPQSFEDVQAYLPPIISVYEQREKLVPKAVLFVKRRIARIAREQDAAASLVSLDVRLVFDYDGLQVEAEDFAERNYKLSTINPGESHLVVFNRDAVVEKALQDCVNATLLQQGLTEVETTISAHSYQIKVLEGWPVFVERLRANLRTHAIQLIDESPKVHILSHDQAQAAQFSLQESGVQDVFSYEMNVVIDGQKLSLLPWLEQLLAQGENLQHLDDGAKLTLPIDADGREYIQLPLGFFRPILQVLFSFSVRPNKEGEVRLAKTEAMALLRSLQAHSGFPIHLKDKTRLLGNLQRMSNPSPVSITRIPALAVQLRAYQLEGLAWLQALREAGFGGILADDMGLGKTLQTLLHLAIEKQEGRLQAGALVIVPTSIMMNWVLEARRYAPHLKTALYYGKQRKFEDQGEVDLFITSYRVARTDIEVLAKTEFDYAILDEAQMIKNAKTSSSRSLQAIRAKNRLCLTGTPLENNLGELWALMDFAIPNLLGTYKQFQQYFQYPIEKEGDIGRRNYLIERIKPFLLRRRKNDVAAELPEKNLIVYPVNLDEQQRMLYEMMRLSLKERVAQALKERGAGQGRIIFLDALLKLRQICCDPRLLNQGVEHSMAPRSAKLEALLMLLEGLIAEGRRILIFSQFTSMLSLIEQELLHRQWPYLLLTGQTRNRQELVDTFQKGEIPIFLISLKAGGSGLNLTQADTVIHYDPWWNPAVEMQATDRAHRIGQSKTVFVYKLVCQGSVEEIMLSIQARKQALFDDILSGNDTRVAELNEDTLDLFFQPLPELGTALK